MSRPVAFPVLISAWIGLTACSGGSKQGQISPIGELSGVAATDGPETGPFQKIVNLAAEFPRLRTRRFPGLGTS